MPLTKRGVSQLTPWPYASTSDYLSSLPPSWTSLQAGLAASAFIVVVLVCAQRIYSWFSQPSTSNLTRPAGLPDHPSQQLFYPPTWSMDEKHRRPQSTGVGGMKGHHVSFRDEEPQPKTALAIDPTWKNHEGSLPRQLMSRPPPAPPLTPPELSTAVFTFDDRPRSADSFINQPNPDYTSMSTTTSASQSSSVSPPTPRRRSYNKTLPIGIPVQHHSSASESDVADLTFSPSSYPPTSPLLPPAPPSTLGHEGEGKGTMREINVQGEIVSILDGDGAGWTRHTRVYGGGVCLACAASGGDHGGGFYGATVRPEEMR